MLSQEHGVSMTVHRSNPELAGILNKILMNIDARAVSDYMMERNVYSMTSVSQFVEDNSVPIIMILLLLLAAVILVTVHILRDTRKIQKLMYKDVDIDIWNLNHLLYAGQKTLEGNRGSERFAIAYLNIVQFQRYKMIYGWNNGQKLLASISNVLSKCVRGDREICSKADGDHFVLLLSSEYGDIEERLENLCGLGEEYVLRQLGNHVELQAGLRFIPSDSADLRNAMSCAVQAIDLISPGCGEKVKVFDTSLERTVKERHERQKLLDSVSIEGNFATYYQAKVDVRTEQIVGAEALVRFLDPTASGAVRSPGFFVPYYEQTGKVTEPGFVEHLMRVIQENQVPKDLIEVEVTETIVMEELQQKVAERTMQDLHARGIRLSIDDFGSGYSSLGVIEKIPASVIKLDRSFLLNQEDRRRQVKIMKRIVDLAEDLNAQIVCEGVETESDVELMREIGANVAQGYRYARPVPEKEFESRLTENAKAG